MKLGLITTIRSYERSTVILELKYYSMPLYDTDVFIDGKSVEQTINDSL